ncbi:uncharacterized protein [Acropora muricata]|uniref:uncharacterized protein isoform X1 n=1 Tax=Acropora muricata TaxID=159855 RepID=UPI0034E472A6
MEQTLRRKVLLSWLILIFLQTAASQSSVMYMMSVSPTTRSEMQSSASSTPTMIVPDQTRGSEMQSSASSTLTIKVSNQTGGSETTTSTEEKTTEPTTRKSIDTLFLKASLFCSLANPVDMQ